ncbi:MAG: hypothetical protein ACP5IC_02690 [Minisyncoccia bacterium]
MNSIECSLDIFQNKLKDVANEIKNNNCFSWINPHSNEKNLIKGMIISPDTDGFVSALLLNEIFNWEVIGFYDGKRLILDKNFDFKSNDIKNKVVFIDIEIIKENIKSVGHHLLLFDSKKPNDKIRKLTNVCIQPNNWRNIDAKNSFERKYPYGTFHFLLSLIYYLDPENRKISFSEGTIKKAITPTLYIDGVFKNMFNYPENCLDWLEYMSNKDNNHPLEKIFGYPTTPKDLMDLMKNFFSEINNFWRNNNRKNRKNGKLNLENDIDENEKIIKNTDKKILTNYLEYLAEKYDWNFNENLWPVVFSNNLNIYNLNKDIKQLSKKNYIEMLSKSNLISFAITSKSRDGLEYTLDENSIF